MELVFLKGIFFLIIVFLCIIFCCLPWLAFHKFQSSLGSPKLMSLANCFTGGVFLGIGLGHMLPEVEEKVGEIGNDFLEHISVGNILAIVGFLLVFFVERVIFEGHSHDTETFEENHLLIYNQDNSIQGSYKTLRKANHSDDENNNFGFVATMLTVILSIHSVFGGLAIGVSQTKSNALLIFIATIGHKWIESFALGIALARSLDSVKSLIKFVSIYSLMTPLGIVLGYFLEMLVKNYGDYVEMIVTALTAGSFLYIAIIDVIGEEYRHHCHKYSKFFSLVFGVSLILVVIHLLPHD